MRQSGGPKSASKNSYISLKRLVQEEAGPDTFLNLKFERVQFEDVANFSGRKLIFRLDFTRARFNTPPIFDGCKGAEHLDFYGARIGFAGKLAVLTPSWTILGGTALRECRKAARGILLAQYWRKGWKGRLSLRMLGHLLWIAVMFGYSLLADYGRSLMRPVVWLIASIVLFQMAYSLVLTEPKKPQPGFLPRLVSAFIDA